MRKQVIIYLRFSGLLVLFLIMYIACKDVNIGYLETRDAIYSPDSMVVKSVLDTTEDADRIKYKIPWQSTTLEGVQGTMPLKYSISKVESDNSFTEAISQLSIVRKGIIEIPWNHTLPKGKYQVSIIVSNEGYSHQLDAIYTLVVK